MESIEKEYERLRKRSNLAKSITDVDRCIQLLQDARAAIASDPDPEAAKATLAKLQQTVPGALDKVNDSQKEIYSGLNRYGRALDKTFKAASTYSTTDYDALSSQSPLINRAIAMHLIREGQFPTSALFLREAGPIDIPPTLTSEFRTLYRILHSLHAHDLTPAITWARAHSAALDQRGSTLEFDLCRLRFIHLFTTPPPSSSSSTTTDPPTPPLAALHYARTEFWRFQEKHLREIEKLMTSFLYTPTLSSSPYAHLFSSPEKLWSSTRHSFTREFCGLLGLAAESPLYVAATAGAIALPTLMKMAGIMKEKKTEWSTVNELPAEIALPEAFRYHSVFVCPVSKEQTTEGNPPMMLPCGHVIALESLQRLAKGGSVGGLKCPYCPRESSLGLAKRVII